MDALSEIAKRLARIERLLRILVEDFRGLKIAFEKTFGAWGIVVGKTAEFLFHKVFREIASRGGIEVDGIRIPALANVRRLVCPSKYEFDLVGEDSEGRTWLVEIKYRFLFRRDVKRFMKRVKRWYDDVRKPFVACMISLVGVEEGVEELLHNWARELGGEALLLRPKLALKLIRLVEPEVEIFSLESTEEDQSGH